MDCAHLTCFLACKWSNLVFGPTYWTGPTSKTGPGQPQKLAQANLKNWPGPISKTGPGQPQTGPGHPLGAGHSLDRATFGPGPGHLGWPRPGWAGLDFKWAQSSSAWPRPPRGPVHPRPGLGRGCGIPDVTISSNKFLNFLRSFKTWPSPQLHAKLRRLGLILMALMALMILVTCLLQLNSLGIIRAWSR